MSAQRSNAVAFHAALVFMLLLMPLPALHDVVARWKGQEVRFNTRPVDPWDPFMGRHMIVQLDLGRLDCTRLPCDGVSPDSDPERVLVVLDCDKGPCRAIGLVGQVSQTGDQPYLALEGWHWSYPDLSEAPAEAIEAAPSSELLYMHEVYFYFDEAGSQSIPEGAENQPAVRGHLWKGRLTPSALEYDNSPNGQ